MQKFQHFLFTSVKPGVVEAQEFANGPLQEFKLLKIGKSETSLYSYRKNQDPVICSASASSYGAEAPRVPLSQHLPICPG